MPLVFCATIDSAHHWYVITHLEVPVHNVMLVDVADALQDLIDAVAAGDREGRDTEERHICQSTAAT